MGKSGQAREYRNGQLKDTEKETKVAVGGGSRLKECVWV